MNTALDISTSGLIAQRIRMNAISSNIANMSTLRDENGKVAPYKARHVIFKTDDQISTASGAMGVKVDSVEVDELEPLTRYQPNHPLADDEGYVAYPKIDMTEQFVNAMEATRAYEANIGVIEMTKGMAQQSLRILA
ncbi:MAG: flagellar basal body rod protein FlgC [Blastopirellula sp.]|nr:MAG: flagellar basal body rod protein FlgC [Blastopirellula sp.]